jgi:hypothetical protein
MQRSEDFRQAHELLFERGFVRRGLLRRYNLDRAHKKRDQNEGRPDPVNVRSAFSHGRIMLNHRRDRKRRGAVIPRIAVRCRENPLGPVNAAFQMRRIVPDSTATCEPK